MLGAKPPALDWRPTSVALSSAGDGVEADDLVDEVLAFGQAAAGVVAQAGGVEDGAVGADLEVADHGAGVEQLALDCASREVDDEDVALVGDRGVGVRRAHRVAAAQPRRVEPPAVG
jgi:hypothetical protein